MEGRGVMADEDECGRSVSERTEAEDLDCGLEEVSGASSKVSCPTGKHFGVIIRGGPLAPSLSELSALPSLESFSVIVPCFCNRQDVTSKDISEIDRCRSINWVIFGSC